MGAAARIDETDDAGWNTQAEPGLDRSLLAVFSPICAILLLLLCTSGACSLLLDTDSLRLPSDAGVDGSMDASVDSGIDGSSDGRSGG